MSITHLNKVDAAASNTTLVYTLGVGESIPAGSTIHVASFSQTNTTHACADSVNGAYTVDADEALGVPAIRAVLHRFSNNDALGEGDTITITYTSAATNRGLFIAWSDDLDLASPLDQVATTADGSSTTPATGGQTLVNDNVRWIGVLGIGAAAIVDFNEDADFTPLHSEDIGTGRAGAYAYRDVAASETNDYTPTLDNSQGWVDLLQAYKIDSNVEVSPTGLPMAMSLGTPTIQAGGNATVNPVGLGMTMALGGATLVIESEGQGGLGTIRMGFGLGIGL